MVKSKGPKFYAVAVGRVAGIYNTWDECKAQTSGYGGAVFKGFTTRHEAQAFCTHAKSSSTVATTATATSSGNAGGGTNQGKKRSREDIVAVASIRLQKAAKLNDKSPTSNFALQITIHFDGGSRGNPGLAGAGAEVVVVDHTTDPISTTTHSVREYCGERATNNYAEYKGLLAGLGRAKSCIEQHASRESSPKRPLLRLQVYGDSNLIIQQLRGNWQCKHPNIVPLFHACQSILGEMKKNDTRSVFEFDHVYREHNKVADALANEAMDRRKSWVTSASDVLGEDDDTKLKGTENIAPALSKQDVIDVDDSDEDSHDDKKLKGSKNIDPALSKQDVIDVDDSDEDSHHSC